MYDEATNDATTAGSGSQAAGGVLATSVRISEEAGRVTDASRELVTRAVLRKFPGDFTRAEEAVSWAFFKLLKSHGMLNYDSRGAQSAFCALWVTVARRMASTVYRQDVRRRSNESRGATAESERVDPASCPCLVSDLTEEMVAEIWRILDQESPAVSLEVLGKYHPEDHPRTDEEIREILFGPNTDPESIRKQINTLRQRRSRFIHRDLASALKLYLEQ